MPSVAQDPVPPVPFRELTLEQAQAHLSAYLAGMPERVEMLREDVPGRGGPSAKELDGSPDSLERLWTWWRTDGAFRQDAREWAWDDPDLPIWLPHESPRRYREWSAALLRDLDRIAGYAGEVIVAADDTALWAVMLPPRGAKGNWQGLHEPVIVSRRVGLRNPRSQIGVFMERWLDPSTDPLLVRERIRLLLPDGVPDDPPKQEPPQGEWRVGALTIDVGPSWEPPFDVVVQVDETADAVVGREVYRALAARIAAADGVEEVIHVDREEFHLRTRLGRDDVERIVRDALRQQPTP